MYSLDQVIYFLEQRQQTEDWNIREAAIAYLRGYREILPEYAQMKLDAVKNDPLTWDELNEMEGKPVWIEGPLITGGPHWIIVGPSHLYDGKIVGYGKSWQAYKKEKI